MEQLRPNHQEPSPATVSEQPLNEAQIHLLRKWSAIKNAVRPTLEALGESRIQKGKR